MVDYRYHILSRIDWGYGKGFIERDLKKVD